MRSPIFLADCISWVMVSAVAPTFWFTATIKLLMMSAMIGSSPVVGSSKKIISGLVAMARARPTRFCIPPDKSDGHASANLLSSPTSDSFSSAISYPLSRVTKPSDISPNEMFSQTGKLSNRAAAWNSIPILLLIFSRSVCLMSITFCPSMVMLPLSGVSSP